MTLESKIISLSKESHCSPILEKKRNQLQYFSLVELLIVVSIFAVLMSLLMPSLKRAINKSKNLVCMNQLKQMGAVWTMYAEDFVYYPDYGTPRPELATTPDSGFLDAARRSSIYLAAKIGDPGSADPSISRVFDLRPSLQSYSGPLNDYMICPLASPEWFQESAVTNPYDIDGGLVHNENAKSQVVYGPVIQSSYMLFPSSHPRNYMLYTKSQMRKPGDSFECINGTATSKSFRLLAADVLYATTLNQLRATQGPYDSAGLVANASNTQPRAYLFKFYETTRANFLSENGSVRSYNDISHYSIYDEQEWLGTFYKSDRGWLLPADQANQ
jgi:type II secretory pathway pseudopilin PulG